MRYTTAIFSTLLLAVLAAGDVNGSTPHCPKSDGLVLQVLGSGGPIAHDDRASSGYLFWINGRSRFLIDAGGGTFLRFGEAGASFADLSLIAITHFHTDHSADLAALLKSGYFSDRTNSLSVSGPAGGGSYPSMDAFLFRLLATNDRLYAYLNGYLDGSAGLVKLDTRIVDPKLRESSRIYADPGGDLEVIALGVPHGPVPALAYRIRVGQKSIVFSGHQHA